MIPISMQTRSERAARLARRGVTRWMLIRTRDEIGDERYEVVSADVLEWCGLSLGDVIDFLMLRLRPVR